jgi:hypothetical protein
MSSPLQLSAAQVVEALRDCISVFIEPIHRERIQNALKEAAGDPMKKMQLMMPLITGLVEAQLHKYGIANIMQALMLFQMHAGTEDTIAEAVTILQQGATGIIPSKDDLTYLLEKLASWSPD